MSDWWKTAFNTDYVAIYKDYEDQTTERIVTFLKQVLPPQGQVIDLGCGTGRITKGLLANGYEAVGIDYSETMLQSAGDGPFYRADMRELETEVTCDAVISIFTSFGYFDDKADDIRVLQNVYTILKPQGTFVLDLSVPKNQGEFVSIDHDDGTHQVHGSYREYTEQEMRDTLVQIGFNQPNVYWWYSVKPLQGNPRRMIFVAQKPNV